MMYHRFLLAVLTAVFIFQTPAEAATYSLDQGHSSVGFKIRHLLSWTRGQFNQFEGTFVYEPGKPEAWKAEAVIQVGSIDTNEPDRDNHLKSADFFDESNFPTMTFKSTKVTDVTDKGAKLHGNLTLHGITKEVVMDLDIHGTVNDPWGNSVAGFTATTTINRKDFGLSWNKALETGQLLVGEEVVITIDIEGVQQ